MALQEGAPELSFDLYDRLRKARELAGIKSLERMAELLSDELETAIKASTVGAWERGANQPTRGLRMQDLVAAWAKVTGFTPGDLWGDPLSRWSTDAPDLTCVDTAIEDAYQLRMTFERPSLALLSS